ncbi:MAG: HEAT repeat domain-containing protein [Candidatus Bilamarchaeum sp.]|jgi:hypothetical protein
MPDTQNAEAPKASIEIKIPNETKTNTPQTVPKSEADEKLTAQIKEAETAMYSIKFYPVAVKEQAKDEAVAKILSLYQKGAETLRQVILYMIHENLSSSSDLKLIHTYDYFKSKTPNLEPSAIRMNVYRAMFNYHTSLEGLAQMVKILGAMKGDDAAKLLTYHYSRLCSYECEANHFLRCAIIEALSKSDSSYALNALIEYARYSDNERIIGRLVVALSAWDEKIGSMKISSKEKEKYRSQLQSLMAPKIGERHYR